MRPSVQGPEPMGSNTGLAGCSLGVDGSRIANGLASLRHVYQNCLARCDGQDGLSPPTPSPPSFLLFLCHGCFVTW